MTEMKLNYAKGDPDTTMNVLDEENGLVSCESGVDVYESTMRIRVGELYCTRVQGHPGNHAAGTGEHIAGVWEDEE